MMELVEGFWPLIIFAKKLSHTLREKYLSVFSPNAESTDQNNSEYGHVLRIDRQLNGS